MVTRSNTDQGDESAGPFPEAVVTAVEGEGTAVGQPVGGKELGLVAALGRVDTDEEAALDELAALL
jgi:hypothetical protein